MPTPREPVNLAYAIGLEPKDAVAYFEQKGYRISWNWQDTAQEAQARAFTVAKAAKMDVLEAIRGGVDQALREGNTERWFIQTLTPVLQEKGWWGKQLTDAGEVQLGSPARLGLIYRQNMASAYNAGRWKQQKENAKARPYWMYVAVRDLKTRPSHAAMHKKVFRHDDPIWKTHYPPCGWNCRCRVRALSLRDLERMGLIAATSKGSLVQTEADIGISSITNKPVRVPVTGIKLRQADDKVITYFTDPGFSYNQGAAAWQPELEKYTADIAGQYVQAMLTGPDFGRFFVGKVDGEFPVGVLDDVSRTALKAESQAVYLSAESRDDHLKKHPEIGLEDYQKIPDILQYGEIYQQGDMRLVFLYEQGFVYRASVKVNGARSRNYFLSLFKTPGEKADRQVREKWERLR